MRSVWVLVCFLIVVGMACGQSVPRELLEWRQHPDTGEQWNLYQRKHCDGKRCYPEVQLGAYLPSSGHYRELIGGNTWSEPKQPPIPPPVRKTGAVEQLDETPVTQNFGVERSKFAKRERITYKGEEITQEQALQLTAGGTPNVLPEDAAKPHLTIVAKDKALLDAIERDLAKPDAAPLAERYRLQVYDASAKVDAEIVKPFAIERDARYAKDGTVCYLQEPMAEGPAKVLCAVSGWKGPGPLLAAVRSADPNWDPNKVSLPASLPSLGAAWEWAKANPLWVLAGVGLIWYVTSRLGLGEKLSNAWTELRRPWAATATTRTVQRTRSRAVAPPPPPPAS